MPWVEDQYLEGERGAGNEEVEDGNASIDHITWGRSRVVAAKDGFGWMIELGSGSVLGVVLASISRFV